MYSYDRSKVAGWPGGPNWDSDEQSILGNLSIDGYKMADKIKDGLMVHLGKLRRAGVPTPPKQQAIENLKQAVEKAASALRQVGYEARRAYDVDW